YYSVRSTGSINTWGGSDPFLLFLKRAFAGGFLRLECLRLTLGIRDGAFAARKPGEACGEDEGEKHHSGREAEANALDEVRVGSRKDGLLRCAIQMLDEPARPALATVSARPRVPTTCRAALPSLV